MALESILGAALVYLSQRDDGVASRLRQVRRTLDGAVDALAAFAGRGELVRLRAALVQDFLIGILAARSPRPPGVLPTQSQGRIELNADDAQHWPPHEGQYDANGVSSRLGEMAALGLALTYEEARTFLIGLTQATAPTAAARQQIGRVAKTLVAVVSSLGLDTTAYERAWRRLFTGQMSELSAVTVTPLSDSPPPDIAASGAAGGANSAARADHAHGHGSQAGGALHAVATPTTPGFLSDVDKSKLDGIAAGATATPLSGIAPPNVAASSSVGAATSAARGDHMHGHGNQAGGSLHALATLTTPGFMSNADKAKLDAIAPGGNSHLQSIQLCASRTQQLLPGSSFGVDGQVEMLSLNVVPDVCTVAGTLHDFWVEGQAFPNVNVTITLLRAPSTGGFPSTTPVTLTVPVGSVSASSAATLAVSAGDRISATSNALWNHSGLVLRARLRA
jgi:hypothetical protein